MASLHRLQSMCVLACASLASSFIACSSSTPVAPILDDAGSDASTDAPAIDGGTGHPQSKIEHLVIVIQENHTFDTYFGKYCTAPSGSNPACTTGPSCCEAGPDKDPSGASPATLDDTLNAAYDPDHTETCEAAEMNGGKMDQYVKGVSCSDGRNFAYADPALVKPYADLAAANALADRYFQPLIGQSSANDMYFARAAFVFTDNTVAPPAVGASCKAGVPPTKSFAETTIADLLVAKGVSWAWYGEGYKTMVDAAGQCPVPSSECGLRLPTYPCLYDPGDVPFQYYPNFTDNPQYMRDYAQLGDDIAAAKLPSVSYVKAIGYHSEHPGYGDKISSGTTFVSDVLAKINGSPYAATTLVLLAYDEGGGYFDHVAPPAASAADGKAYGTRVPLLAIGPFAKKNTVSHVVMEHSSIVKFIEWNWLGATGQLGTRDKEVNNIGSLLDPAATGTPVPEK